jgi:hypothetical protein
MDESRMPKIQHSSCCSVAAVSGLSHYLGLGCSTRGLVRRSEIAATEATNVMPWLSW